MDPGQVIRDRRIANRLTQEQLARRVGSTQAAISRLERGHISPTFETFEGILHAMGEEAKLVVRRGSGDHDRRRILALRQRPAAERLALAISWNRLAGEFARAGAAARAEASVRRSAT